MGQAPVPPTPRWSLPGTQSRPHLPQPVGAVSTQKGDNLAPPLAKAPSGSLFHVTLHFIDEAVQDQWFFPRPHSWRTGTGWPDQRQIRSSLPTTLPGASSSPFFPPHSLILLLLLCPLTTCSTLLVRLLPRFPTSLAGYLEQTTEERPLSRG